MTLGEKIYKLRTKRSMTQEQLAEKIGVSRQSVSKWETDSAIPDIEKLKLLAEIFEVSITELLGMECEEDTKRKDEKESIEHCQKEIKRWKRWKDLKNHGQMGYSYEYKNTGKLYDDYTDGKIIIKIKYYNKELKKNVEIWINPWEGIESREKILLKD